MPRRCRTDPLLPDLLAAQDRVVHRDQALALGLSRHAVAHRRRYDDWQLLLPDVYLTHAGEPSRRQLLVAGLLYAGPDAAVDDVDACRFHGVHAVGVDDDRVFVVAPQGSPARSRDFLTVRRTSAAFAVVHTAMLRYVEPATAVIAVTRRLHSRRAVLAVLSDALQRRVTTYDDLVRAHVRGSPRNARLAEAALEQLGAGIRSAPEADFRLLAESSLVLPPLLYNCLLRLPGGRIVSPDALAVDAGVVHETNGRAAHAREDLFEDMQERHDAMTDAGLVVLHNSPHRIRLRGREVIAQVERVYLRHAGRGLPDGVEIVRLAA